MPSKQVVKKLTSGAAIGLLGEELLYLLGEVALGAPHQPYGAEDHKHGKQAQPKGLLDHSLTEAYYIW